MYVLSVTILTVLVVDAMMTRYISTMSPGTLRSAVLNHVITKEFQLTDVIVTFCTEAEVTNRNSHGCYTNFDTRPTARSYSILDFVVLFLPL